MGAPKGNTYAVGNGRPPKYESADELKDAIDKYLQQEGPKTITGLALALGFESRQSLYDYEQKESFSYIIRRAKLFVENYYEMQLIDGSSAQGAKFALQQMGWSSKSVHDLKSSDGSMSPPQNLKELYDAEAESES
jgi:hypothetical protein